MIDDVQCINERRRQLMRDQADEDNGLNGIDYVEIVEGSSQRELCVHFFGELPQLTPSNIQIRGGRRITDIKAIDVQPHRSGDPEHQDCLRVLLDKAGDFSCYEICLRETDESQLRSDQPLKSFDSRYVCAEFYFKVECPSDFDCRETPVCQPTALPVPEINYLAKDYSSFRQLLFDRLALIMPDWQEKHVPDLGVALLEVLAYTGDYLSYYQDAVATEAYLNTARQRISVRRHTRLVDYFLHEGCNARAWIAVSTNQDLNDPSLTYKELYFTTGDSDNADVFEPVVADPAARVQLHIGHNEINFYTWGDTECCLPRGATTATLLDEWVVKQEPNTPKQAGKSNPPSYPDRKLRNLQPGDVLIFMEVLGPKTGDPADADTSHRHAVRLTRVTPIEDTLIKRTVSGSNEAKPTRLVEIEWSQEDALPFPLCLSSRKPIPECSLVENVSIALGNVILVDHGRTIDAPEYLGQVKSIATVGDCGCDGSVMDLTSRPAKFAPVLQRKPLTFRQDVQWSGSAAASLIQDPRQAIPQILEISGVPADLPKPGSDIPVPIAGVNSDDKRWQWHAQRDLLASGQLDQYFVVEIDSDGEAHLRFGDGELGRLPDASLMFLATYRVGNGSAGNVGMDTINTVAWRKERVSDLVLAARNPMPAVGGVEPESVDEARLFAPRAFLKRLERAVTAEDYARLAERFSATRIQRAGGSLRWMGSWYVAQVSIDPEGTETADTTLLNRVKEYLYPYRRIGHEVEVQQARYVPLEIALDVCVLPHYLRGDVEAAVLQVLSNKLLPDGSRGFFHPDNLTFGDGIYMSKLVALVQGVTGVESVRVKVLQRLGEGDRGEIEQGILKLGPLEVAQLDNDPNFPERGILRLTMRGGR